MSEPTFEPHRVRGPVNAAFFSACGGFIDHLVRQRKARILQGVPDEVVELGPGVGANLRYLPPGTRLIAVEPNPHMHPGLRRRAAAHGLDLDIRSVVGETVDLPDASTDMVISSLVLCSVADPHRVVAEARRILRPGGRYAFLEHVAAPAGTVLRRVQRGVRRPWAWAFEGCSVERDLAAVIRGAGFSSVDIEEYTLRSPFLPANSQIAGVAVR